MTTARRLGQKPTAFLPLKYDIPELWTGYNSFIHSFHGVTE